MKLVQFPGWAQRHHAGKIFLLERNTRAVLAAPPGYSDPKLEPDVDEAVHTIVANWDEQHARNAQTQADVHANVDVGQCEKSVHVYASGQNKEQLVVCVEYNSIRSERGS